MVIDHPRMQRRLLDTFNKYRRKPKELAPRLNGVFQSNEQEVMRFVQAANESPSNWKEVMAHGL